MAVGAFWLPNGHGPLQIAGSPDAERVLGGKRRAEGG